MIYIQDALSIRWSSNIYTQSLILRILYPESYALMIYIQDSLPIRWSSNIYTQSLIPRVLYSESYTQSLML